MLFAARGVLLYALRDKLEEVFDGSQYGMEPLSEEEKTWLGQENDEPYPDYVEAECPKWLFEKINDVNFCKALNTTATTDIRAHGISREELCMAWQSGEMEVQDEASQVAAILADVKKEHKIIDYCCGAGGKALAMSDILQNEGKILAHDIDAKRLAAIKPRMARLKVKNIELTDIIADSDKNFDRFILDAPCSGSGTWRRAPDAKFRLSEQRLKNLNQTQAELLELAAKKTKTGGRIVYITCSVLREENEEIVKKFLATHREFAPVNLKNLWQQKIEAPYPCGNDFYLRMSPFTCGTDGFFVCGLEKKS